MSSTVTDHYTENLNNCNQEISKYSGLINRFSALRLITLIAGIFLFYQSLKVENSWLPVAVFFLFIFTFALLVRRQNFFEKRHNYFKDLAKVQTNEIASIINRDNMYDDGAKWIDDQHPYSSDLDIFGKKSLFSLVNRCATALGNKRLADWLNSPAQLATINQRQQAVEELASKETWKHNFQTVLLFSNQSKEDHVQKLFQYMHLAPGVQKNAIRFYLKWAPFLFLTTAVLSWYINFMLLLVLALGITNMLLTQSYFYLVAKTDGLIGKMSKTLENFSAAISAIRDEEWQSVLCKHLSEDLKDDQKGKLPEQIKKLSVLINMLDLGLSPIGPILNFVMPWNVKQFFAIEDWKRSNKINLEEAFDKIASFEAIISISSLKNNYPDWSTPLIVDNEQYTLECSAIGHPLIPENLRISNDYSLSNELKIDIITGSNMAGKSTFLRTLGINTVLALAGAPVCAKRMELTPMLVFSYMRIRDSLNESTSTFKAELDRLQALLETLNSNNKVFFLIDEMLRGTNSVDKYLGSKAIIEKLISQKAVGIIATHDLQIAELEQNYPDYIRNFYFDIEIEGDEMKFDYKLKLGECKTFNASILLRRLGI